MIIDEKRDLFWTAAADSKLKMLFKDLLLDSEEESEKFCYGKPPENATNVKCEREDHSFF